MIVLRAWGWFGYGATVLLAVAALAEAGQIGPLTAAVKRGDRTAVRTLVRRSPAAVKAAEADGTTPLHWAVLAGDAAMVDVLLKAGAKVNARNRYGITPLALAAQDGDLEVMTRLIEAGGDVNATRVAGDSVLMTAARTGNAEAVRLLVRHGADVHVHESTLGETALAWAAAENHPAVVAVLVESGADANGRSTALTFPEFQWQGLSMVKARLPRGGWTPLMHAARQGALDGVRALADHGADINLRDPDGMTALVAAIINAHYDVASLLLDRGADPNIGDMTGMAALYALVDMRTLANMQGRPAPKLVDATDTLTLFNKLIEKGADPNARLSRTIIGRHHGQGDPLLSEGATPLHRAAKSLDVEMMRLLLEHGSQPLAAKADGTTSLMLAAGGQVPRNLGLAPVAAAELTVSGVGLLLDRGGDPGAFNRFGQTALHFAVERGADVSVVQLLVSRGADPDFRDRQGRTALDLASRPARGAANENREKVVSLLRGVTKAAPAVAPEPSEASTP